MATEAQKRARDKYNSENIIKKTISFNKNTEKDLLEQIEGKQFSSYIKQLIKEDIKKSRLSDGKNRESQHPE